MWFFNRVWPTTNYFVTFKPRSGQLSNNVIFYRQETSSPSWFRSSKSKPDLNTLDFKSCYRFFLEPCVILETCFYTLKTHRLKFGQKWFWLATETFLKIYIDLKSEIRPSLKNTSSTFVGYFWFIAALLVQKKTFFFFKFFSTNKTIINQ